MITFRKIVLFIICVGLLSGCGGQHSMVPELPGPLPENFIGAGPTQDFSEPGRFWEQFNDPKLKRLVEQALDGNLSIRHAMARYDQFTPMGQIKRARLVPFLKPLLLLAYRLRTNLNLASMH